MTISRRFADALVQDASPTLALARVDLLHLPGRLFSVALLPQPVFAECQARPDRADPQAELAAKEAGTIRLSDVPGGNAPPAVAGLGVGEAGVIRLCLAHHATALLDDKLARRAALNAGLRALGVVGLLRLAKQQGLVETLGPALAELKASGYYRAADLVEAPLRAEGE